jgi:hypothetical protein
MKSLEPSQGDAAFGPHLALAEPPNVFRNATQSFVLAAEGINYGAFLGSHSRENIGSINN